MMGEERKNEFGYGKLTMVVSAIVAAVLTAVASIAYFMDQGEYDPDNNTEGQDVYEEAMWVEPAEQWHSITAFDSATQENGFFRHLPIHL